tara:strand:+ start:204 stop:566 length:363 start_codon:yes stop_codon:yes gene_type:complete
MNIQQTHPNHSLNKPLRVSYSLVDETISNSAKAMPINNKAIVEPNVIRKTLNNVNSNFYKQIYSSGNNSSSHGSLTESFLRAKTSFSPAYMHNEISTRYNMISAIPIKLVQIRKSIDKVA